MQGSVDPDYLAAASYLSEVGFTNKTEIARVLDIAMNPNSMFVAVSVNANARPLTVEADMQPVVQFLRSRGVSVGDTVKVWTNREVGAGRGGGGGECCVGSGREGGRYAAGGAVPAAPRSVSG